MTPQDLISAFDVLAEAPDGVARLRELVLSLAVRGKLVAQDAGDEPASVLLGKRTVETTVPPFVLPAGWAWSTLQKLGEVRGGGTPSKRNPRFWGGSIPWVSPKDMKRDFIGESQDSITAAAVEGSSVKEIPENSLLMVVRGMILAHSFPTALTTTIVTVNQDMKALLPFSEDLAPYLLLATKGAKQRVLDLVERSTHGTCKLPTKSIMLMPIGIPPLAEQRRIVARVDELMGLLDRLEAARATRDEVRRAARDAALADLRNAPDAEAVEAAWGRIARQMDDLFLAPEDVAPLRQAVLQLAVRGRFSDLPVSEVRLNDVVDPDRPVSYGVLVPGPQVDDGVPLVRVSDLDSRSPAATTSKSISPQVAEQYSRVRLAGDELLLGVVGSIGKVGVASPAWKGAVVARAVVRMGIKPEVNRDYILLALQSPVLQGYFHDATRTLAQPTLNVGLIRKAPVPLPPRSAQDATVAKVDDLMALCDDLEARLTTATDLHGQFAAAAVHHLDA